MKNAKTTRRALFSSVIALVLCFTMLMGTTFAWFTDSVSSAGNKIQSGTLKVDIVDETGASLANKTLEFVTDDEEILWEPGCTYYLTPVYVKNDGSLALKYKVVLNLDDVTGDTELLEALEWTVLSAVPASREALATATAVDLDTFEGHLAANAVADDPIVIVAHMKEEAGNEYQGLTIDNVSITVVATQDTVESDSFDNQYDADAIFYDKLVTTDAELKAAIEDPDVKTITISGDLTYDWGDVTDGATALDGITLVGYNGTDDSITFKGLGAVNDIPNVTLKNITVKNGTTYNDTRVEWEFDHLEFDSLNANNVVFANSILLRGYSTLTNCSIDNQVTGWYGLWIHDGNATLTNCTFTGTRAVKICDMYTTGEVGTVVIDGCTFMNLTEKPGVAIDDEDTQDMDITIKNSTFINCQAGDQGLYIYETDNTVPTLENNTVLNNAAVVSTTAELQDAIANGADGVILGSGNYIIPDSAQGKTLTIIGNGETVVATQDDGSYEGCDYSLDGATVTFENVTINTDSTTYTGYARCKGTYNNCTINGTYTLYGDSVFNNCTFNVSGDVYNIWTWGAPNATFNNCTFNSDGKALLLYGQVNTKLTVNDCVFNDNGGLDVLKAAIEIGNDYNKSYELIVNNTTVNGYAINDKGISTGTTLWANKNSMTTDKLNVVVDNVDVY